VSAKDNRACALSRTSKETDLALELRLGGGPVEVRTGIGFLDHLVSSLALHAGFGLVLACAADTWVDDHHGAEDCALALGEALARALASGGKPRRFGSAHAPLDEALARAVVDLSGRPCCRAELGLAGARLGGLSGEMAEHFLSSLAAAARITLHVDVLAGTNAHHKAEAAFKALALALREACALEDSAGPAGEPGSTAGASAKGQVALAPIESGGLEAALGRVKARAAAAREGAR